MSNKKKPSASSQLELQFYMEAKDLSTSDLRTRLAQAQKVEARVDADIARLSNELAGQRAAKRVLTAEVAVFGAVIEARR